MRSLPQNTAWETQKCAVESRRSKPWRISEVCRLFKEQIMEVISQLLGLLFIFPRNLGKVLSLSLPRISLVVHFGVQQGLQSFLTRTSAGRANLGGFFGVFFCPWMFECLFLLAVLMEKRGWKGGWPLCHKWAVSWLRLTGERDVKRGYLGLEMLGNF